jgi:predicted enzyme related to lactoylglutathione lyase
MPPLVRKIVRWKGMGNHMEVLGTDFVLFQVSDLQEAIKFYRDFLGLPLEFYKEEWKWALA